MCPELFKELMGSVMDAESLLKKRAEASDRKPLPDNWMRVAPGTDAAIWRPWSRETGEL